MNLAVLIPAVLTYVREKGGIATKTKLLKLLYLLDIEAYRNVQKTLTGFDWFFYLYGPWAQQYDAILAELESAKTISLITTSRSGHEITFVDSRERVPLSDAFPKIVDELRARRIIEAWADRPTSELLDYVYFHTAPMREARRGELLDFNTVLLEEPVPDYRRATSGVEPDTLKRRQRDFFEALRAGSKKSASEGLIEPKYDSEFWQAIETLERDPD